MSEFDYDLFTIGAGSGGVRASRFAASHGARVAVAEAGPLGGTCVNVGCIPKKMLSYAAHFHDDFEAASGYGWTLGAGTHAAHFDWATLIANKDREIARLNGVYDRILTQAGVTILRGHARLTDAHTVEIGGRRVTARHILIATGGRPQMAPIPGAERAINSNQAFHLKALPRRVVVFGAGYIAVEFASIFNGLGAQTTLVARGPQLLKDFDADLGSHLAIEMAKKGVDLKLSTNIERILPCGDAHTVLLDTGESLEVDCVMFATGRVPNVKDLGLESAGVKQGSKGEVLVDEHYDTNVPSIHAIGDVTNRLQLTPVALAEGMALADRLFNKGARQVGYDLVPTAIFSHPNIATVGLSESAARAAHKSLKIFKSDFKTLKNTLTTSDEKVFLKLVVDADTDRVLGIHMVGPDAGEVIQGFAVALNCGATKAQFDSTIGIHPTLAEEFVTMRTPASE